MKEEILNLSNISVHQILLIEEKGGHESFCIVKSNNPVKVSEKDIRLSLRDKKDIIIKMGCHKIIMFEFNGDSTRHSATFTKKHLDGRFESIVNRDFSYKFFTATMDDVNNFLTKQRAKKVNEAIADFNNDLSRINTDYDSRVGNALRKMIK